MDNGKDRIYMHQSDNDALKEKFPHGFRVTGSRTSGYGCSSFILHHFFPLRFPLFDTDYDLSVQNRNVTPIVRI